MGEQVTYEEFINNILSSRGRFACGDEYHERHHIIPRCMGGPDNEENLIDLFAREHFIAHKLLAEENPENKRLVYAWWMMAHIGRVEISAEEYEESKRAISKTMSDRIITDETKNKISVATKGEKNPNYGNHKLAGESHPNYGRHLSEETKKKIGESNRNPSEKTRQKMRDNHADVFGGNNPRAKIVMCVETKMIYLSGTLAGKAYGIHSTGITRCCCGKQKAAGGYVWKYIYDTVNTDGVIVPGALTLGLITTDEILQRIGETK